MFCSFGETLISSFQNALRVIGGVNTNCAALIFQITNRRLPQKIDTRMRSATIGMSMNRACFGRGKVGGDISFSRIEDRKNPLTAINRFFRTLGGIPLERSLFSRMRYFLESLHY